MEKKIRTLTMSQQSIQTLSLWCIHHRKHAKTVVQFWFKELQRVKPKKKLALMYLSNDILQNSRRKGGEYAKEFGNVMPNALVHCSELHDAKITEALRRIIGIWKERNVYPVPMCERLTKCLDQAGFGEEASTTPPLDPSPVKEVKQVEQEIEFSVTEYKRPDQPPDPDELVKRLQDLENSATQDAVVRERIANLPTAVTDPTHIDKVQDLVEAKKLKEEIDNACSLLAEYNARLETEQKDRQTAQKMLLDYTACQKYQLAITQERIEEYVGKLQKVTAVEKELQSHLDNLPDLSKLPNPVPLPSAGDLFATSSKGVK